MSGMKASEVREVLCAAMAGAEISVRDDTHKHEGHNEQVGHYGSHFLVRIIWDGFAGLSRVERHRKVFEILRTHWDEKRIHSLSLRLLTTVEAAA